MKRWSFIAVSLLVLMGIPNSGLAGFLQVPEQYSTITQACAVADSGDTVGVYPGHYYNEEAVVRPGVSVIGMGEDWHDVIVSPDGSRPFYVIAGSGPVLIKGMYINAGSECCVENRNYGLVVENCLLTTLDVWEFWLVNASADFMLKYCSLWYVCQANEPIHLEQAAHVLIEDCVWGSVVYIGWDVPPGSCFEIRNNTFYYTIVNVFAASSTDFSVYFVNNIIPRAICWDPVPDTVEWRYNDFHLPGDPWPDCGYQVGNFTAPPLFCDWPTDLRLRPDSPCIRAGENGENVGARLGICWPPQGVADEMPGRALQFHVSPPWPTPTTGGVTLVLDGEPGALIAARVFDVAGNLIRSLPDVLSGRGMRLYWDGRIGDGRLAPAGVYYLRVRAGDTEVGKRILVVR